MVTVDDAHRRRSNKWTLCPLWIPAPSSTQNLHNHPQILRNSIGGVATTTRSSTISSVARSLFPARRRLRVDPSTSMFFPYEPGMQVRSAVRIKNATKSHVAFKFQTTAPKSCYMRPPGGILAPGETLIPTVYKFVEQPDNNEKPMNQKSNVKFKIMSLKVKEGTNFVPELFDEQWDQVVIERILKVVFLDTKRANPALDKLKRQLAEADAAIEARNKPPAKTGPRGVGLVIDEWKERREKYLARQQVQAVDSI